jgi:hypothetical protein
MVKIKDLRVDASAHLGATSVNKPRGKTPGDHSVESHLRKLL